MRLMAALTANHGSYFTANAVRLWLHSSGNGLHKKEVDPHVGTRPGLGVLTLFHKNSGGGTNRGQRGPLVAAAVNYTRLFHQRRR